MDALAGKPVPADRLIDPESLINKYYSGKPDPAVVEQQVSFGTSGHRGTSASLSFNEAHILATAQAICDYRKKEGIDGPLFMGKDTHCLSRPAEKTALEVLAANGVEVVIQSGDGYTPTPVISHSILVHNRANKRRADGIVITPSHNPPSDGGFKYNPPNGGPADTDVTNWIQDRANELLRSGSAQVKRIPYESARKAQNVHEKDFVPGYISDLKNIVDMEAISGAGLKLGVDPLGGASVDYWAPMADMYRLDLTTVNKQVDPRFSFMTLDHDGKVRMDCSSVHAMANLIRLKDDYSVAFGNDPDVDRHGIVCRSSGLMNPNHYLAVAVSYLFAHRPQWPKDAAVGKTLVSSGIIDRVADSLGRAVMEVPVGFKWFVDGLLSGKLGFGGEESAGASFLRKDGAAWATDKDGMIMDLLAAEIVARTGKDPAQHFKDLASRFGMPYYTRIDRAATAQQKAAFKKLVPDAVKASRLAGDAITARLTKAPGNGASIGGLKIVTANGWFAARPSGTENIYKVYAESFKDEAHLQQIVAEAQEIVTAALS